MSPLIATTLVCAAFAVVLAVLVGAIRAGSEILKENTELRMDNAALVQRLYEWSQGSSLPSRPPSVAPRGFSDPPLTPATSFFATRKPQPPSPNVPR